MAITIKQIALKAGLSVPTVSRILNNDAELFRPETRDKVHTAARELGYRPNSFRMALRTKKFNSIGLLFNADPSRTSLSCETQCALLHELHLRDHHLVAGQLGSGPQGGNGTLPKILREWSVDGLLIDSADCRSDAVDELIRRGSIPAIWLGAKRPVDCVYADLKAGAEHGVQQLLNLGHRKVMFLNLGDPAICPEREAGYEAAMKAAGLPTRILAPGVIEHAHRAAFLRDWIQSRQPSDLPTAIFCRSTGEAMPLYLAATQVGLSVPRDLSILTLHDAPADALGLRISAVRVDAAKMVILALNTLEEKIADTAKEIAPRVLPLDFDPGETLAPAKA